MSETERIALVGGRTTCRGTASADIFIGNPRDSAEEQLGRTANPLLHLHSAHTSVTMALIYSFGMQYTNRCLFVACGVCELLQSCTVSLHISTLRPLERKSFQC